VISVGNLAVGGSGKTPFVLLLGERLVLGGIKVAVLSRGYGGTASRSAGARVVSRGAGPEVSALEAGDEPVLIAEKMRGVSVVVARRRIDAARLAVRELGAEVLVLDDGFQHLALARDLDIALIDGDRASPGRLLPLGRLREPFSALARADLVVRVRSGGDRTEGTPPIDRPLVDVEVVPVSVRAIEGGAAQTPASLSGKRVALLAAIARPRRFEALTRRLGAEIAHAEFHGDHAPLDRALVEGFRKRARERGVDLMLTTEKDSVRLVGELRAGFFALAIAHRIVAGESNLDAALHRVLGAWTQHASGQ
jgi:tetraacyldisaccharide 4'-kinase